VHSEVQSPSLVFLSIYLAVCAGMFHVRRQKLALLVLLSLQYMDPENFGSCRPAKCTAMNADVERESGFRLPVGVKRYP
jgi:hypothetical protein